MAATGDVYSGAAQALQQAASNTFNMGIQGAQFKEQKAARALAAEENRQQAQMRELQMSDMFKKNLLEAADEPDPAIRKAAFKMLFGSAEKFTNQKAPQALTQLANSNPEILKEVLMGADSEGMTLMDVWKVAGDPLKGAQALLAFGKAKQNKATRNALGEGGGQGTMPMVSPQDESGPNAALISSLQIRTSALRQGLKNAVGAGASDAGIKEIQAKLKVEEDRLFDLMKAGGAARTSEGAKPVPEGMLAKAKDDLGERARPGMTYDELRAAYGEANKATAVKQPTKPAPRQPTVTDVSVEARPLRPETSITASPLAAPQGVGSLSEKGEIAFRERQQAREATAPVWMQQEYGISTMGQYADGVASGKIAPISGAEMARREQASREIERVYGKKFEAISSAGEKARTSRVQAEAMYSLLDRAGSTGALITPIRQGVNNFVQALSGGTIQPQGMDELQMLSQFSTKMAIEDLQRVGGNDSDRDFLRAVTSNPNIFSTRSANKTMLLYRMAVDTIEEHRAIQGQKWVDKYGSLSKVGEGGKTFDQAWGEWSRKPNNSALSVLRDNLGFKEDSKVYEALGLPQPKKGNK